MEISFSIPLFDGNRSPPARLQAVHPVVILPSKTVKIN
ncbi:hypothetical protein B4100_3197 [Heyndrickxia coagulans]|nr:hypothetical protein B4100_3197 [Heyndrickxia coagulans]